MREIWTGFEHSIWQKLKEHNLDKHNNFILAVSGGLDSMVLLQIFLKLKPQCNLKVAHYHHGCTIDKSQEKFRSRAYEVVKHKVSQQFLKPNKTNLVFCAARSSEVLSSEEQMRNSRWNYLRSLVTSDEVIVTGHHLDDAYETMLLKMIRGTTADGLLAFKMWNKEVFRPFLQTSKSDLMAYAQKQGITWLDDPSNSEDSYLRNWLREKWLKDLDKRVNSGRKNLFRSLLKMSMALNETQTLELVFVDRLGSGILNRQWYVSLSKVDQLRSLALFLKKHQIYKFTSGQLEEIRKRLDKNQKDITFDLLGKKWVINASQIMLQ